MQDDFLQFYTLGLGRKGGPVFRALFNLRETKTKWDSGFAGIDVKSHYVALMGRTLFDKRCDHLIARIDLTRIRLSIDP